MVFVHLAEKKMLTNHYGCNMPFKSKKQMEWYYATGQTFWDDELGLKHKRSKRK